MIAAALIICPLFGLLGYKHWLDTRTFNPLSIPVSLSRGHIRTPDFYVNLTGTYRISVDVDYAATYTPGCQREAWESLKTRSVAYQNSVSIGEADGPTYGSIGWLTVDKKGHYSLDVEVLSDATCLNASHPKLTVWNVSDFPYDDLYQIGIWAVPIPVAAALGLLGWVFLAPIGRKAQTPLGVVDRESSSVTTALQPLALPLSKPLSALPHFGLFCGTILALLVFVMMILTAPIPPKGIYVSLKVSESGPPSPSLMPPILVRVESNPDPHFAPKVYVNSSAVEWSGMKESLKNELKLRPEWVVYIDGDGNVPWQYVVNVADTARELHAKVVLLTPTTKKLLVPAVTQRTGQL